MDVGRSGTVVDEAERSDISQRAVNKGTKGSVKLRKRSNGRAGCSFVLKMPPPRSLAMHACLEYLGILEAVESPLARTRRFGMRIVIIQL